jgi:hypothetical protein
VVLPAWGLAGRVAPWAWIGRRRGEADAEQPGESNPGSHRRCACDSRESHSVTPSLVSAAMFASPD